MAEFREIAAIKQLDSLNLRKKLSGNELKTYDAMVENLKQTQVDFYAVDKNLGETRELLASRTLELENAKTMLDSQSLKLKDSEKMLADRTLELNSAKIKLDSQSSKLNEAEKLLSSRTLELDDTKKQLERQSLKLNDAEKLLSSRTLELDDAKKLLSSRTLELDDAKKLLNSQSLKLGETEKILDGKISELAKTSVELETAKRVLDLQSVAFDRNRAKLEQELEQAQSNLEKTKKAVPYTPDTISSYLNNTIREFNESNASDDKMARYVINSMDVDLKVRVFDDSENDKDSPIKFVAPKVSETSEDSLSSLKISIQAVPK